MLIFFLFRQSEKRSSNFMYLMVEFPRVKTNDKEYSIVYYEKVYPRLQEHYSMYHHVKIFVVVITLEPKLYDWFISFSLNSGWRWCFPRPHQLRYRQSSWSTDGDGEHTHTHNKRQFREFKTVLGMFTELFLVFVSFRRTWLRVNITNWLVASAAGRQITTWNQTRPRGISLM